MHGCPCRGGYSRRPATIRSGWRPSQVSASRPARSSPRHRGHCRVGTVEQPRRTNVVTVSGNGEAMDQQPRQRQRDGHQQPSTQPDGQESPHVQRPFFPACRAAQAACPRSGHASSALGIPHAGAGRTAAAARSRQRAAAAAAEACPVTFAALPQARRSNHGVGNADPCRPCASRPALAGDGMDVRVLRIRRKRPCAARIADALPNRGRSPC